MLCENFEKGLTTEMIILRLIWIFEGYELLQDTITTTIIPTRTPTTHPHDPHPPLHSPILVEYRHFNPTITIPLKIE